MGLVSRMQREAVQSTHELVSCDETFGPAEFHAVKKILVIVPCDIVRDWRFSRALQGLQRENQFLKSSPKTKSTASPRVGAQLAIPCLICLALPCFQLFGAVAWWCGLPLHTFFHAFLLDHVK